LANELGVKVLTLYAFSTENWKRPKTEVEFLMKLPEEFLTTFLPELIEKNVQVRIMGDKSELPAHTIRAVDNAIEKTKHNTGLILNFALNYGSRHEIMGAIQSLVEDVEQGKVASSSISENLFSSYLMSKSLPDPDLLIRTSGELRLSNFMLWQLAYTEFWFTEVLWPDFKENHLIEAVEAFQKRGRRFGGV
jgi:undecaprenyl diphosphate synthase